MGKAKKEPEVTSGRDPRERKAILETVEQMSLYRLRMLLNKDLGVDPRKVKEIELKGKTAMVTAIVTMYDEGQDLPGILIGSRPVEESGGEDKENKKMAKKTPAKDPFADDDDEPTPTSSDDGPEDDEQDGQEEHVVEDDEAPPPAKGKGKKAPAKTPVNEDGESTAVEDKLDQIMNLVTGIDNIMTDVGMKFVAVQEKVDSIHAMVMDLRAKGLVAIDVLYRMGHQIWKLGTAKPMVSKDGKAQAFKTLYDDAVLRVSDQLEEQDKSKE